MERRDRGPVATFYSVHLTAGGEVALGESAARHARVRRLGAGDLIRLTNGSGEITFGVIRALRKTELIADVAAVDRVPPLPLLELLAPVADRDRMLWLAEKATELGVSVWQPVVFARSWSVAPRGEGEAFAAKVRSRMIAALEQSGGAWLPEIRLELPLEAAASSAAAQRRYVLDRGGSRLDPADASHGVAVLLGPEGGIEPHEHELLTALGWQRAGLTRTTLRFETAGIAAVAILRAAINEGNAEN